jgi:aldehyde:ferredoxin oxidoreductase
MYGWQGHFLHVNLTKSKAVADDYDVGFAFNYLGGRGFAARLLWDQLKPGTDPLSPDNILIFAAGPLTGFGLPNSGKLVVAAKSPLTGGYGDGNIGTNAAVQMRKAGYDAIIVEGKAKTPVFIHIKDKVAEFVDAKNLWGLDAFETEKQLKPMFERTAGIVSIGPAGENLVKFATIVAQEGRSGGRPGMGTVMGSKNLKAVVIEGLSMLQPAHPKEFKELAAAGYRELMTKPNYEFWTRQGTMSTIEWCQENSCLPTLNFREGVFDEASEIGGFAMEKMKIGNRGCPQCNMTCGNIVRGSDKKESELDYENVAMLGSNIGLGNLLQVAALNRAADELGLDSISLGNVLGFIMEASERKLIAERIHWGKFKDTKALVMDIAYRRGLGSILAEGVKRVSERVGHGSSDWAMHVKGLEVSAYDCHVAPLMALSYGTSLIGAHHKDAWIIGWEVQYGRDSYNEEKVTRLIEMQRLRGGVFEALTLCRFPHVQLGLELEWYPKFLQTATGMELTWATLNQIADRTSQLIRAFWVREFGKNWTRDMDEPPNRWFKEPLTKGRLKGKTLDKEKFDGTLSRYYKKKGWDERGIPRRSTLQKYGLGDVAGTLNKYVALVD